MRQDIEKVLKYQAFFIYSLTSANLMHHHHHHHHHLQARINHLPKVRPVCFHFHSLRTVLRVR